MRVCGQATRMTKARSRGELLSSSCFDLSFVKVLVGMSGGKLALELFAATVLLVAFSWSTSRLLMHLSGAAWRFKLETWLILPVTLDSEPAPLRVGGAARP